MGSRGLPYIQVDQIVTLFPSGANRAKGALKFLKTFEDTGLQK